MLVDIKLVKTIDRIEVYVGGEVHDSELRIYTNFPVHDNNTWLHQIKKGLVENGFSQCAVDAIRYSRLDLQRSNYVSLTYSNALLNEYIRKNADIVSDCVC